MNGMHEAIAAYYASGAVRGRLAEYCHSAIAFSGYGGRQGLHDHMGSPVPTNGIDMSPLLAAGADVCRSLADGEGTLLHLDLDSYNPSDHGESLERPERTFGRLEPVYRTVLAAFTRYGIEPLVLLTGRGYHFVARARWGTPLFEALLGVGHLGAPLRAKYEALSHTVPAAVRMGLAHEGAGRLLELLAHEVIRSASPGVRRVLARFHASFDGEAPLDPRDWPATYDRLALDRLPECVASALRRPNPALLEPARPGVVARALFAMGWSPRAVAGLVRSKYERDFGWGGLWYRYDAAARADFYVRLFCGAFVDGTDDEESFDCATEQERGVCTGRGCGYELGRLLEIAPCAPRTAP